jgi:hypothetical protein
VSRFPDAERSRAILIGASDYEHSDQFPNLPAVRNNLVGLERVLADPVTGIFSQSNCAVADSPDSPKTFMQRLGRAAGEAEDTLLVYYAGHGTLGWGGDLHLAVRESDNRQTVGTAVPFEWVKATIQNSPARIRIVILDCCFSGRAIGAMSSDDAALEQVDVSGTTILTSTTANQVSHAVPGEHYTAFTGELIRVLTSGAVDTLTLGEIYRPLLSAMARRSLPRPKIVISETAGQLALRKANAPQAQQPVQPTPPRPKMGISETAGQLGLRKANAPQAQQLVQPSPYATEPSGAHTDPRPEPPAYDGAWAAARQYPESPVGGVPYVDPFAERFAAITPLAHRRPARKDVQKLLYVFFPVMWIVWLVRKRNSFSASVSACLALLFGGTFVTGIVQMVQGKDTSGIGAQIFALVVTLSLTGTFAIPVVRTVHGYLISRTNRHVQQEIGVK